MTAFLDKNLLVDLSDSASLEKQGKACQVFLVRALRNEVLPSTEVLEGVPIVNPFRPAPT